MADKYISSTDLGYYHSRLKTIFAAKDEVEPNVIETVKLNGTVLTPDASKAVDVQALEDLEIAMTVNQDASLVDITEATAPGSVRYRIDIHQPTSTSEFANDGDGNSPFATQSYVAENGGKIDTIAVNGTNQAITNKRVNLTVPTKASDLTNDIDFQTEAQVQALIDAELAEITGIDFQVVSTLPATGAKGVIYLLHNVTSETDIYDEYIWVTPTSGASHYEQIGTTAVDLSGYWAKGDLVAMTTAEIDALFE